MYVSMLCTYMDDLYGSFVVVSVVVVLTVVVVVRSKASFSLVVNILQVWLWKAL